jgi:hypothetical protein
MVHSSSSIIISLIFPIDQGFQFEAEPLEKERDVLVAQALSLLLPV